MNQAEQILVILLIDDDPDEHLVLKQTLKKVEGSSISLDYVEDILSAVDRIKRKGIDIVFLDNRLDPHIDFRETAPRLRQAGFTGPIGVISSDISASYIQQFPEFGVDFRIGKDEIDAAAISFILSEYSRDQFDDGCDEDFS